jgi:muramoyltetrapeptide carboxypeptidase
VSARLDARGHVVAPSGPVAAERFDRGLRILRRAVQADWIVAGNIFEQEGYFAGSDAQRLAALHTALGDDESLALVCARGGYGATRLLSALDPERLRARPRPIVGFSDITALLCWAWVRAQSPSIHGPVVTQLSELPPDDIDRLATWILGDVPSPLEADAGTVVAGGTVEGTMFAANLEVLRSLVGTRFLPSMRGAILALEEIGERPYRIDRALTQLLSSGALRGIRGVVVGQLHACEEPESGTPGPTASEVFEERLATLGVPVVTGFPFGHAQRNAALPFGARVRLRAEDCTLEFLEPVRGPR